MHHFEFKNAFPVICWFLLVESGFCAFFHPKATGAELNNYFWDVQLNWEDAKEPAQYVDHEDCTEIYELLRVSVSLRAHDDVDITEETIDQLHVEGRTLKFSPVVCEYYYDEATSVDEIIDSGASNANGIAELGFDVRDLWDPSEDTLKVVLASGYKINAVFAVTWSEQDKAFNLLKSIYLSPTVDDEHDNLGLLDDLFDYMYMLVDNYPHKPSKLNQLSLRFDQLNSQESEVLCRQVLDTAHYGTKYTFVEVSGKPEVKKLLLSSLKECHLHVLTCVVKSIADQKKMQLHVINSYDPHYVSVFVSKPTDIGAEAKNTSGVAGARKIPKQEANKGFLTANSEVKDLRTMIARDPSEGICTQLEGVPANPRFRKIPYSESIIDFHLDSYVMDIAVLN